MALTKSERLRAVHTEALAEFDAINSAVRDERMQALDDRRFYSIAGAQWEGPLTEQFENRPKMEVNKIHLSVMRIINEYRANRITVDFISKEGDEYDKLAETCDDLYRADEQDSGAEEAYDNAFEEAVGGGFGAWRLRTAYEDDEDEEDDKQRIRIEPIFDADSSVYFDLNAKRQDKADAKRAFVLTAMTPEAYEAEFKESPASWEKSIGRTEFDWLTPDVVYVAEYYRVEEKSELIHVYRDLGGEEERYADAELTKEKLAELDAIGSVKVRQKRVKRKRVHKYILSGGGVLEDCGYIAGKHIPIVPVFGKRWFIDNIERFMGHVRLAKDAQRLKNMQLSKLAEISALSSVSKPILFPEQIAGHQVMWAEDNIKNYPYLLINPVTGQDGQQALTGPTAYTKAPDIPPSLAALLQITEQDMRDVLGNQEQGEKTVSNISAKAIELIQSKLDMQTQIYVTNMAKAIKRSGEIWLSMAKDIFVEEGRKMKGIASDGTLKSVELMRPVINEKTGETETENDLSDADFDIAVEVGPSSSSKRSATVRSLTNMLAITSDPETAQVLQAMTMLNMEGEGISDVRDYFRAKMVKMGVIKPNEEEAAAMAEAAQNQEPDPQQQYLLSAAKEAEAKALKTMAETTLTEAKTAETKAKTIETLSNVEGGVSGMNAPTERAAPAQASAAPVAPVADDLAQRKLELDMRNAEIEQEIKIRQLMKETAQSDAIEAESQAVASLAEAGSVIRDAVVGLADGVKGFQSAVEMMTAANSETSDKAIEAIKRPKRVIRDKGRIVGIE